MNSLEKQISFCNATVNWEEFRLVIFDKESYNIQGIFSSKKKQFIHRSNKYITDDKDVYICSDLREFIVFGSMLRQVWFLNKLLI